MGVSIWEGSKAGAAVAALERQNLLLTQLIQSQSEATPIATLNEIAEIVRRGEAPNVFNIGDQINVNWNNGQNDYVLPFDITHFGDVQLQDGETIPGMFIQSHYALDGVSGGQSVTIVTNLDTLETAVTYTDE